MLSRTGRSSFAILLEVKKKFLGFGLSCFVFFCCNLSFSAFYVPGNGLFVDLGIVGLEAALLDPEKVRGVMLINVSLRMLHIKKQQWYVRPFVRALQNVLR
jgi:hypothetical protein